jgi:acyl carrier protein
MSRDGAAPLTWEQFQSQLVEILDTQAAAVEEDARLIEDLGADSVALAEIATFLLLDCGLESLADDLDRRDWEGVTAGQIYRECAALPR